MKKYLWIIAAILVAAVIAVVVFVMPEQGDEQSLVFLMVKDSDDGSFYGVDGNGDLWLVHGEYDTGWACTWVRFDGEPSESAEDQVQYEVTAKECWYMKEHTKADTVYQAFDVCTFDIDGDGTAEECIISCDTNAIMDTIYILTVWEGDTYETSTEIFLDGSMSALAFLEVDGKLKIIGVDWPYGDERWEMATYNISLQGSRLTVSRQADT